MEKNEIEVLRILHVCRELTFVDLVSHINHNSDIHGLANKGEKIKTILHEFKDELYISTPDEITFKIEPKGDSLYNRIKEEQSIQRQECEFRKRATEAQTNLNNSQITTNNYIKWTSVATTLLTFTIAVIAYLEYTKQNNELRIDTKQEQIKQLIKPIDKTTDTTGNGKPTLSDSLGVSK